MVLARIEETGQNALNEQWADRRFPNPETLQSHFLSCEGGGNAMRKARPLLLLAAAITST